MYKVVINSCYGGFSLSDEARDMLYETNPEMFELYVDYKGKECKYLKDDVPRHNKNLVEVVEALGERANGMCANLAVEEIITPMYRIDEYDGNETLYQPDGFEWCDASED